MYSEDEHVPMLVDDKCVAEHFAVKANQSMIVKLSHCVKKMIPTIMFFSKSILTSAFMENRFTGQENRFILFGQYSLAVKMTSEQSDASIDECTYSALCLTEGFFRSNISS